MPAKDGTGPSDQGTRTGRSAGNFSGQAGAGTGRGEGRGSGCGGGRGMGGRGLGVNASQGNSWLQTQISDLQADVKKLAERLGKLEEVKSNS